MKASVATFSLYTSRKIGSSKGNCIPSTGMIQLVIGSQQVQQIIVFNNFKHRLKLA